MKQVIMILVVCMLAGCALFKKNEDTIIGVDSNRVYAEKNRAAELLKLVDGVNYNSRVNFKFRTVPGEQMFSGCWAWKPDPNGQWICGSFNQWSDPYEIIIAANPNNPNDYNTDIAIHEFAHYHRYSTMHDPSHDGKFSGVIFNWWPSFDRASVNTNRVHYDGIPPHPLSIKKRVK